MNDPDAFVRQTAAFYGHEVEDAFAARDLLNLRPEDLVVRLTQLADFARTFGVNILSLAGLIAETGTGIDPWKTDDRYSSEDWKRVRDAEDRLASGGDWPGTILALLDEVERLRTNEEPHDGRPSP